MRFELMIFCLRDKRLTPLGQKGKKKFGFQIGDFCLSRVSIVFPIVSQYIQLNVRINKYINFRL